MALRCAKYQVAPDRDLIRSKKREVFSMPGSHTLYKIVDIHYLGYDWVLLCSWENASDIPRKEKVTTNSGLRVKSGEQFFQSLEVTSEYKGLEFSCKAEAELSHKSFTERETTLSRQFEEEFEVAAHTSIFLYQKVYHFRTDVWFQLNLPDRLYTVGRPQGDGIALCQSEASIESEEFIQEKKELTGMRMLEIETVERADVEGKVRRFDECPEPCQSMLRKMGL